MNIDGVTYWKQRAEEAERDNADLLSILREIDYSDPARAERLLRQAREGTHPGRDLMANMIRAVAEQRSELEAARGVIAAARTGFGTEEDIKRAWAFDPNLLTARIRAYDETVKQS